MFLISDAKVQQFSETTKLIELMNVNCGRIIKNPYDEITRHRVKTINEKTTKRTSAYCRILIFTLL